MSLQACRFCTFHIKGIIQCVLYVTDFFFSACQGPSMLQHVSISSFLFTAAAAKSPQSCLTLVWPHRPQPTRLRRPWDSPGKNTGEGCHFLLQCVKVKSENEVAQSCPTLHNPMDCSPPGSPVPGIFQARVLEWGAIASSLPVHCQTIFYCTDRGNVLLITDIFLSPFPLSARLPANTNTLDGELFLFLTHPLGGALPSVHTDESHIHAGKSHSPLSAVSLCLWSYRNPPTAFAVASGTGKNGKSLLWGRHLTFGPAARIQTR